MAKRNMELKSLLMKVTLETLEQKMAPLENKLASL